MEKEELYKKTFDQKIIDLEVKEESLLIKFETSELSLASEHSQDCCESVYADFSIVVYHKEHLIDKTLGELLIKGVEGMGFLLCFGFGYKTDEKIFIPCYNYQNGYYSDSLSLEIKEGATTTTLDIGELVEDHID